MDVSEAGQSGGHLRGAGGGDRPGQSLTRVYFNPDIDRSEWGPGPWDDEPDKISWTDESTDLPCLLVRNGMGVWCGYVAVEPGHPLHGTDYWGLNLDVHGGLTFSSYCAEEGAEAGNICHVPGPGKPANVWWYGFDSGHAWDLVPSMLRMWRELGDALVGINHSYRTASYMRTECERLARQLSDLSGRTN